MTVSRVAIRIVLLLTSLTIALCSIEAILRHDFERLPLPFLVYAHHNLKDSHPKVWTELRRQLPFLNGRQEDPDVGWTFLPGSRSTGVNEDGEPFDLTTSREGFYTPSVPDRGVPQLVTLGDSFLSTFYVRQPMAWVLQSGLGMPVYNLAVGGWGPDNYLAAYRKFAVGRAHRRVVVFTFLNDISDVLNWHEWKSEEPARESFLMWIQRTNSQQVVNIDNSWFDRSLVLWNYAKFLRQKRGDVLKAAPEPQNNAAKRGVSVAAKPVQAGPATPPQAEIISAGNHTLPFQFTRGYSFEELDPEAFEPGGNYYQYIQAYFESLERLKDAIHEQHAQMILVWIPSKERVYLPLLPHDRYVQYVTNQSGKIDGLEHIIGAYAAQSGIAFLDLTPVLQEHARAGEKLYFTVDGHLNSAGNELAGRSVVDFLETVSDPPAPVRVSPPVIYRHGPSLAVDRLHSREVSYRARLVVDRGEGWQLKGRAEAPYSYVLEWPPRQISGPMFLVARGVVRDGGLTIGLQENDKWVLQTNVGPGRFDLAIPVVRSGMYSVVLANNLPKTSLRTDVEIDDLGWAPVD